MLLLGGTTEASAIARALAGDARFDLTLSFAGRTRAIVPPPVPYRVGGFGGAPGLAHTLRETGTDALVDATHPFAARISANAAVAAHEGGVRLLGVRRPPWRCVPGDRWHEVADMAEAARALGAAPRRVLLTVGQLDLLPFAAVPQHRYVVRSVDPPPAGLLPGADIIAARGPFAEDAERALLVDRRIDVIVTKNSGGTATAAKLIAARDLGLRVVMVDRPALPPVESVETAEAAVDWLIRHHDARTDRGV